MLRSLILATVLGSLLTGVATADTIDFDDLSGQGIAWSSTRYLSHEVEFTGDSGQFAWSDPSPLYGGQAVATTPPTYVYSGTGSLGFAGMTVTFWDAGNLTTPGVTDSFSFDVVDYTQEQAQGWSWSAFDVAGNILSAGTGAASGATVSYSTASAVIHGFRFVPSSDTEGMDTVVFGDVVDATAVPASPLLPLGGLLIGLGVLAHTRRTSTI